jgi:hypothetical protein
MMRKRLLKSVAVGSLATALLLVVGTAVQAQQNRPRVQAAPAAGQSRLVDLPPGWIEQLQEMSPADQERFFRNNARFRTLPPQRQALIRRRLRAWNNLSEEQREALLERQQIWEQLPLEQRQQVRESLLPRWQSLPFRSRQVILGKLRELRGLDDEDREAKLSDESFLENMSIEERQLLRDLSNLVVTDSDG